MSIQDHHVIPRSKGGTKTVPLCEDCHGKVHRKDLRIAQLTRDALALKKSRGELTGDPPLGFRAVYRGDVRVLEPDPHERAAFARAADLTRAGKSLRQIAAMLTTEGYKPRGKAWYASTLSKAIRVTLCTG
jgi:hypothetical protein